jgi:hypothetical protein
MYSSRRVESQPSTATSPQRGVATCWDIGMAPLAFMLSGFGRLHAWPSAQINHRGEYQSTRCKCCDSRRERFSVRVSPTSQRGIQGARDEDEDERLAFLGWTVGKLRTQLGRHYERTGLSGKELDRECYRGKACCTTAQNRYPVPAVPFTAYDADLCQT